MHEIDYELIKETKTRIRTSAAAQAESLQSDLDAYKMAASLSRGQDLARCRHWAFTANELQTRLRRRVGLRPLTSEGGGK